MRSDGIRRLYDGPPMARKDRAPNPPKRPQAPQRRTTSSAGRDPAAQRRLLYIIAATGLVALAIVLGVVFLTGAGGDDDLAATMESAGEFGFGVRVPLASLLTTAGSTPSLRARPPGVSSFASSTF